MPTKRSYPFLVIALRLAEEQGHVAMSAQGPIVRHATQHGRPWKAWQPRIIDCS
jgi:hypothetical protein